MRQRRLSQVAARDRGRVLYKAAIEKLRQLPTSSLALSCGFLMGASRLLRLFATVFRTSDINVPV
jgi:hypothetical protein